MTSEPDIEAVVGKLTPGQREAVKREAALSIRVARSLLSELRLYDSFTHWTGHHWYPLSNPTDLGKQVREHLTKEVDRG